MQLKSSAYLTQQLQRDLMPGEQILWIGQPDATQIFSLTDIYLIPFSLLWGGFAFFWEFSAFQLTTRHHAVNPSAVIGVPFSLVALYMIIGRFFVKVWRRQRTVYAVTNQRVLISVTLFSRNLTSLFIRDIPAINENSGSNGSGNIYFGEPPGCGPFAGTVDDSGSGMEFFGQQRYRNPVPAFYSIPNVARVAAIIRDVKRGAR